MFRNACVLLLFFCYQSVVAIELDLDERKELNGLAKLFSGEAGGYVVVGGSLFSEEKEGIKKEDYQEINLEEKTKVAKAWLVWMGDEANKKISFQAHDKWHVLESENTNENKELRCQRVEVSKYLKGSCRVVVKGFSFKDRPKVAGWALIVILEGNEGKLKIHQGLSRLKPAESYSLNLVEDKEYKAYELTVIGGGGLAGNGSLNQFNGKALSKGDDWNGSSGKWWDVDSYNLEKIPSNKEKADFLTIDPLLQWLFPVAVICYMKKS